jgi:hypothetical protein
MCELNTDSDAFLNLFSHFRHAAYRLEVRTMYGTAGEDEPYQQFLAHQDPGRRWFQPWLDLMTEQTRMGKLVERVRVVDEPPSPYLRFELFNTPHNLDAGEDIRYLARSEATTLDLPDYDYWVFDSRLLVFLRFGDDDRFLGFEQTDDPAVVLRHLQAKDAAWHHALTFGDYVEKHPEIHVTGG